MRFGADAVACFGDENKAASRNMIAWPALPRWARDPQKLSGE
jgi:hypothetical protein